MSEENMNFVRRAYESIAAVGRTEPGELDPETIAADVWNGVAPGFELHERQDLPDAKVYLGKEAAKEFWRKTSEVFAEIRWDVRELFDMDGVVIADSKIVAIGRGSDVEVEMQEFDVFTFRDGLLIRLRAFGSLEDAIAAAEAERYELNSVQES